MHIAARPPPKKLRGFSLIELMVAVVIVGVLLAVAQPGYTQFVIRSNKAAAKAVLLDVSSRQEQYMMTSGAYASTVTALNVTVPTDVSNYFDVTLTAGTNTASTVTALQGMPIFTISASGKTGTIQANNPAAGATTALSINQFGLKLPTSEW